MGLESGAPSQRPPGSEAAAESAARHGLPANWRVESPWATGPSRFLLPLAWCVWLLVWLVPVLVIAPHAQTVRPWLEADTAPAALVAGATFFLVAIWPFWPALARRDSAGNVAHWIGASLLELVMLLALAAPFVLVAWSVGDRTLAVKPLLAAAMAPTFFALVFRVLAMRLGAAAVRWLILAAMLLSAGPLIVVYAAGETIGADLPRLAAVSPIVMAVWQADHGWPSDLWLFSLEVAACGVLALAPVAASLWPRPAH